MFFFIVGAVSAAELNNASNTEDSNLMTDDVNSLSVENNLEVSNEDSISETNIVNSHDDDLNNENVQTSNYNESGNNNTDGDVLSVSNDNTVSATPAKTSTKLTVEDTHYGKSATYFKVTLKDANGNGISNQKISLKVNGVTYTATTNSNGIADRKSVV